MAYSLNIAQLKMFAGNWLQALQGHFVQSENRECLRK